MALAGASIGLLDSSSPRASPYLRTPGNCVLYALLLRPSQLRLVLSLQFAVPFNTLASLASSPRLMSIFPSCCLSSLYKLRLTHALFFVLLRLLLLHPSVRFQSRHRHCLRRAPPSRCPEIYVPQPITEYQCRRPGRRIPRNKYQSRRHQRHAPQGRRNVSLDTTQSQPPITRIRTHTPLVNITKVRRICVSETFAPSYGLSFVSLFSHRPPTPP